MYDLVGVFTSNSDTKTRKDDDFTDRLNCQYTVAVCVVFALMVSMHQFVGDPISCFPPQHLTDNQVKYANAYCWVRNTYYLHFDEEIPKEHEHEKRQMIPYYQWIPFILLGQALMFYLPSAVWHSFNHSAGVDADNILESAQSLTKTETAGNRDKIIRITCNQIDKFLVSRKALRKSQWKHAIMTQKGRLCCRRYNYT